MKKNSNVRRKIRRLFLLVLCLSLIATNFNGLIASAGNTSGKTVGTSDHIADTDTSDSYSELIDLRDNSRRAGRVWADKSVFTDDIELDMDTDGIADGTKIMNGSDFLHMFSALGSSQSVKTIQALDVVFVLDTSASMSSQGEYQFLNNGKIVHKGYDENKNPRLEYAVDSLNEAIGKLMDSSEYNRVSLVTFNLGATTVMPLDRYNPTTVNRTSTQSGGLHNGEERYLTIAQASNTRNNGRTGATKNKIDPTLTDNPTAIKPNNTEYDYDSSNYLIAKTKNNDNRFLQQYNTTLESNTEKQRFIDSQGTLDDWKIIEVNAVSEKTCKSDKINTSGYGVYRSTTKGSDGLGIPYIHTSAGTDTYWGIMEGMQVLSTENETKLTLYKDKAGNIYEKGEEPGNTQLDEVKIQRQPILVLLTDGAPNPDSTGTRGYPYNWWNGDLSKGYTDKSIIARYDAANGFLVAATAAYQKQFVEQHYYGKIPTSKDGYNTLFYNIGLCMDNPDSSVANTAHDGQVAQAALNPSSFLTNPGKYEYFTTINNWWRNYYNNGANLNNGSRYITLQAKGSYNMYHPSSNDITSIDYPTEFHGADNPDELPAIFEDILDKFMTNVFTPVEGPNDAGLDNILTYMDPIGQYMEVKDVKNVLLFGELYNVDPAAVDSNGNPVMKYFDASDNQVTNADDIKNGNYAYSTVNYKIVPKAAGNTLRNPNYGNTSNITFNLSDIDIYLKITGNYHDNNGNSGIESDMGGSEQTLYVNIPAQALPIQVATITLDNNGDFLGYATNIGLSDKDNNDAYIAKKKQSTPLRVIYEVGIADDIKTENGNVDLTKVGAEYLSKYRDNGKVYFYSNWYNFDKNGYEGYVATDTYTFGNPVLTFKASSDNRYYVFEKSRLIFKRTDKNDTEGGKITSDSNGNYYLNDTKLEMVTNDFTQDGYYYVMIEYYDRSGLVQYALPRQASEFGLGVSGEENEYLCWYNPATGDTKEFNNYDSTPYPGAGYYIAAKEGGLRVGDMSAGIGLKANEAAGLKNKTATAQTYYMPTISSTSGGGNVVMNLYLGNNGRLAVNNTLLLVTKTVNRIGDISLSDDTEFKYTIELEGVEDGAHDVIVAAWEGEPYNVWRTLVDKIELLTNNDGLLMQSNGDIATYKQDGNEYYIYVGGSTSSSEEGGHSFVYFDHSNKDHSFADMLGGGTTITTQAYLVPVDMYNSDAGWNYEEGKDANRVIKRNDFPIGLVDPQDIGHAISIGEVVQKADGTGFEIGKTYNSKVTYLTKTLTFKDGVAEFTLKNGEGLLFNGLDSGTEYTVKEILTEQSSDGITLQSITHVKNDGEEKISKDYVGTSPDSTGITSGNTANDETYTFDNDQHTYAVYGETTPLFAEEVNYFNYVPKTEKYIIDHEEGDFVEIGEELTYLIYWENYAMDSDGNYVASTVTVKDPLDDGVDFIDASMKEDSTQSYDWSYDYDEDNHIVTWTINAQAKQYGYVELKVKVNENADKYWNDYVDADGSTTPDNDYAVLNRGSVQVGEYHEIFTDIVRNVTGTPHKTETKIDDIDVTLKKDETSGNLVGPLVKDGDKIEYAITYVNYNDENSANITVTDKLDPGVKFVSASWNGVTRQASGADINQSDVKIKYDAATHTVTWTILNVAPLTGGNVTMVVQLDEDIATKEWGYVGDGIEGSELGENPDYKIVNRASVQVVALVSGDSNGDGVVDEDEFIPDPNPDEPRITETIENPVGTPHKTETKVDGTDVTLKENEDTGYLVGPWVKDDGLVEYSISYVNYNETDAEITITDKLDPGVEFVSATWNDVTLGESKSSIDQDGVKITYDKDTHTVIWVISKVAPLTKGNVTMVVKVNEDVALKEWNYVGDGIDGSELGEDPDYRILNRASVAVGALVGVDTDDDGNIDEYVPEYDDPSITETVENPVGSPHKTETKVDGTDVTLKEDKETGNLVGPRVQDDNLIEYSISYVNYNDTDAEITITDRLDPGVEFVSATWNGVTLNAPNVESEPSNAVKITYDAATHTVKWVISKVAPLSDGKVTMVVQLNEDIASKEWGYTGDGITGPDSVSDENFDYKIFNRASVAVGALVGVDTDNDGNIDEYVPEYDDPSITETIENPVGSEISFPSAGGMGVGLFYILGGLLVINAALWLVIQAKKKKTAKQ
ncbi:MAG: hypothetical protein J1E36_05200 [Eubacterium sp.]|nr:hypothetical protein [Eubacterium sp.]